MADQSLDILIRTLAETKGAEAVQEALDRVKGTTEAASGAAETQAVNVSRVSRALAIQFPLLGRLLRLLTDWKMGAIGVALVAGRALAKYFDDTSKLIEGSAAKWESYREVFAQHKRDIEAVQLAYEKWRREMEAARRAEGKSPIEVVGKDAPEAERARAWLEQEAWVAGKQKEVEQAKADLERLESPEALDRRLAAVKKNREMTKADLDNQTLELQRLAALEKEAARPRTAMEIEQGIAAPTMMPWQRERLAALRLNQPGLQALLEQQDRTIKTLEPTMVERKGEYEAAQERMARAQAAALKGREAGRDAGAAFGEMGRTDVGQRVLRAAALADIHAGGGKLSPAEIEELRLWMRFKGSNEKNNREVLTLLAAMNDNQEQFNRALRELKAGQARLGAGAAR